MEQIEPELEQFLLSGAKINVSPLSIGACITFFGQYSRPMVCTAAAVRTVLLEGDTMLNSTHF
jgi:hypothetical protein